MQMKHGRKLVIAMPYVWLILLFLLPFLIVFKISLAEMARAIPPYTNLLDWADGQLTLTLKPRQLPAAHRRSALFRSLSAVAAGGGDLDALLSGDGLSAGVGGGAQQAVDA
jgi:ABC-type spermidine/putrescine transport system permease subunit I